MGRIEEGEARVGRIARERQLYTSSLPGDRGQLRSGISVLEAWFADELALASVEKDWAARLNRFRAIVEHWCSPRNWRGNSPITASRYPPGDRFTGTSRTACVTIGQAEAISSYRCAAELIEPIVWRSPV